MYLFNVIFFLLLSNVICEIKNVINNLPLQWRDVFKDVKPHPDSGLNIYEFLKKYNYPYETHRVTTEDGYVLRMHRLIGGQNHTNVKVPNKPVVLLMHGLTSSSMDWVNMGRKNGLGLLLADNGYDVWLGNNRGNMWSREHVYLNPDIDSEYWNFSFDECGYYDLPAKIDYILEKTGQQKLFYVGLSQGTTQFFAMAALRPEYNNKIALMSALAPVAYMKHLACPMAQLAVKYLDVLQKLAKFLHIHELLGFNPFLSGLLRLICADGSPLQELCAMALFFGSGFDNEQLNRSILSVAVSNLPAGFSYNMLIHYGQEIQSGYFRRYDYGVKKNLEIYKSELPPNYNLSAISAPIALYYGQNDLLAAVQDVEQLASQLPNVKKYLVEYKQWTHVDFVVAKDLHTMVFKDLLAYQEVFMDNGTLTTVTTLTPSITKKPSGNGNQHALSKYLYGFIAIMIWTM